MPEIDERAMKFVEETLQKSPEIELSDLFQRTKKVSRSIGKLSKRQFNARYPLQVKRRRALAVRAGGQRRKTSPPAKIAARKKTNVRSSAARGSEPRDVVRHVLLQFATDIAAAEERKDLVKVLAGVDHYVDLVLEGVGKV